MVCLARSDDLFKKESKKRKNLINQIKNISTETLTCVNEAYPLAKVCNVNYGNSMPCTLNNGDEIQLNPV